MQLQISGQHMSVGVSLQEYVSEKTISSVTKYFSDAPSGHVYFSKQEGNISCEIVVNEGSGRHIVIKSNCKATDAYTAFDSSLSKLEKQLRRYKSRLQDKSKMLKISEIKNDAVKYIISSRGVHEDNEEFDIDNPAIVAEKPVPLMHLSVGEAVMKMDLENLPALMFKNSKNDRINVVYYRKDGNISWVDTSWQAASEA